ncbi:MAG: NAD(P)-dependent oxidoreductase [Butyrivibrio sp.]|nr:NAD(P)-dependent oxidoreductase [Butyrivibrio sp.]
MKRVIVTGAAGFAGANLCIELNKSNIEVLAIVRENSTHNDRLKNLENVTMINCDMDNYEMLPEKITGSCDTFFHLAWKGDRDNAEVEYPNVFHTVKAVEAAAKLGCKRFVATGSQAEYGAINRVQTEDMCPAPINAYGAAKAAALYMSKRRCEQLEIDWIWGRIFSLYGLYEPGGRLVTDLANALLSGKGMKVSAATQNWDYLYSMDGAKALIALAEKGRSGEIYNIANGDYKPLKVYLEEMKTILCKSAELEYDMNNVPKVSLQPSIDKIYKDTGWKPEVTFEEGIRNTFLDR